MGRVGQNSKPKVSGPRGHGVHNKHSGTSERLFVPFASFSNAILHPFLFNQPLYLTPQFSYILSFLMDMDTMECPLSKHIDATLHLLSISLETTLRNFSCLTTGDSIIVAYNNKKYYIDIIESKPSNAISIIETDCEVDFAPPLDYKEPEKPVASVPSSKAPAEGQEAPSEAEPKFNPFTGAGRRLDGKLLKNEPPPASSSSGSKDKCRANVSNGRGQPSAGSSSSSQSSTRQTQGKLVFGSNANRDTGKQKEAAKETKQEQPQSKEEPKFQSFTGKKYSLKG